MTEPAMSAMEASLRRALEAGDVLDPTFRESIYSASERALERMLAGKNLSEEAANGQRARLAETINRIEDEFYERQTAAGAAEDGPAQLDPELALNPAYAEAHGYAAHDPGAAEQRRYAPAPDDQVDEFLLNPVFPEPEGESRPAIAMSASAADDGAEVREPIRPSPRARSEEAMRQATKRSRPVLAIAILAVLLVVAGLWVAFGPRENASENGATSWIELFDGQRLEAVATPNGGRMDALSEGANGRPALRFTPSGAGSALAVAVGPGVARDIDGRSVDVELTAGSPDGAARSFAVRCLFDGTDVCGEKVFTTARRSETFTFAMNVPARASRGSLEIAPVPPDARGEFDLFGLRLKSQAS